MIVDTSGDGPVSALLPLLEQAASASAGIAAARQPPSLLMGRMGSPLITAMRVISPLVAMWPVCRDKANLDFTVLMYLDKSN
ncbi:MAG TPA: hypothetical protein VFO01_13015 [Trebonia sp.]|nr:hypothetical protein [Trebonia sp.]